MPDAPAVIVSVPTVTARLTVDSSTEWVEDEQTIAVPFAMLNTVELFMPPGVNFSVGVAIAFNGKRLLPNETDTEYVIGSGFLHRYPLGIPVQDSVTVQFRHRNIYSHEVFVALHMDYRPIQTVRSGGLNMTPK